MSSSMGITFLPVPASSTPSYLSGVAEQTRAQVDSALSISGRISYRSHRPLQQISTRHAWFVDLRPVAQSRPLLEERGRSQRHAPNYSGPLNHRPDP
eukprot:11161158-Alexandrium_andersonii.AAC.1